MENQYLKWLSKDSHFDSYATSLFNIKYVTPTYTGPSPSHLYITSLLPTDPPVSTLVIVMFCLSLSGALRLVRGVVC